MSEINKNAKLSNMVTTGEFGYYLKNPMNIQNRIKLVGENLLFLRKKADLSQKDLCRIVGCATQTYSGYENGHHEPNIETLVRLAHIYNISVDYIIGTRYDEGRNIQEEVDNIYENPTFEEIQTQMKIMQHEINDLKNQMGKPL